MVLKTSVYQSTASEMLGYHPVGKKITVVRVECSVTGLYVDSWKKNSQHANAQEARYKLIMALDELTTPGEEVDKAVLATAVLGKAFTSLADAAKYSKECLMDFGKAEETVVAALVAKGLDMGFKVKPLAWSVENPSD